jgi:hypothetical protein
MQPPFSMFQMRVEAGQTATGQEHSRTIEVLVFISDVPRISLAAYFANSFRSIESPIAL